MTNKVSIEKKALVKVLGNATAYYPTFSKALGDACAGILVSRLFYWMDKTQDPDGWIYKTAGELEDETGLTRNNQMTARKKAKELGVLEEKLKGVPATMHYRINLDNLLKLVADDSRHTWRDHEMAKRALDLYRSSLPESDKLEIPTSSSTESDKLDVRNPTNQIDGSQQTSFTEGSKPLYTMDTTVVTSVVTSGGDPRLQDLPASKQSQTAPPPASPEEQEKAVPVQQQQARDESARIRAYANSLRSSIAKPTGDPLVDAAAAKFNGDRGYGEKRACDVHTQRAEKIGLTPVMFRSMVDCLLDATKKRAAVDNFSDERSSRTLAEHKEVILALAEAFPSYRTATDVQTIVDAFFAEKKYKDIHVGQYRDYAADWLTRKPKISPQAQRQADEAADQAWAVAGGVLEDVGEMYKPAPIKPEYNMRFDPITRRLVHKDAPLGS